VSRREDQTRWRDPQSGYLRRNISPATGVRDGSIHQQIWVQEGSIEVTLRSVTHRLSKDDCLAMQLNEPTAFRNRTRKPARYMVVVASERSRAWRR
jgi:glyoxylate utilization-related uncharacterized protein